MKRPLLHRLGALTLACAFALATGGAAAAELGCLHHGSHHGHGVAEPHAPDRGQARDPDAGAHGDQDPAHSGHAGGADHDAAAHHPAPPDSSHHDGAPCSCVGSCHAGGGVAIGEPGASVLPSSAVAVHRQRRPGAASGPRPPTRRLLPFANAPPPSR